MNDEINNELKMKVHEMINYATQALWRYDMNDTHYYTLLQLLRYNSKEFIQMFEEIMRREEE